ncbi:cupin domain-containing protein [Methanonatronarchaeum sp. AMET6-2]|uniref:cupin domain-containing protein n=1 Tax=Methanonatronarchaeum sp. AMET6-2 TaxID=2933293 RepID=UPI001211F9BE|nr:cupin domain-containing protein [Methanonatronarchaeum sp. AMET6-2]RZN63044.1 MAG: cupin domain-containing protein [Methanonatronarchaeia archaeon]UOY10259.1 cupin domain-containing protein [Methanonatronarchaeum sp. AMET6-2]
MKEELSSLEGEIHRLGELVDYQEDSIVSRTLMDRDSGSLTLFAIDKGQNISEHTAPYDALAIILDGKAEITIEQEKYTVKKDESIVMPKNKPHSLRGTEKFKMFLIMMK